MSSTTQSPASGGARGEARTDDFSPDSAGIGEIDLIDLAVIMAENIRLLIYGPFLIGLVALGATFLVTPVFTARTSFIPPQQQQSASTAMLAQLGSLAGLAASTGALKNPSDQYVALLKSATIADRLIDRFGLIEIYGEELKQSTREELADRTSIFAGKDGLIVVRVDDESPQRAANIANAYVTELQQLLGRLALTEAQQRRAFFEKQLEETRRNLADAEKALVATGITASVLKANPQTAVEGIAALQARVTAQEIKLSVMRGYYTESAPEFVQAQSELTALRTQLRRAEISEPKISQNSGYIETFRRFKYHETLFELFARQFELAKVDEAREGAVIQVVDEASAPERKSKPRRALIALIASLALGLVLAISVVVAHYVAATERTDMGGQKVAAIRRGLLKLVFLRRSE